MPPDRVPSVDVDLHFLVAFDITPFPLLFFRGGKGVNLWITTRYLSLFTCSTIMVFSYFDLSLSRSPIPSSPLYPYFLINQ
jgi:hypothetical protein